MNQNVSVITYNNPYTFHTKDAVRQHQSALHLCATTSLASGLKSMSNMFPYITATREIVDKFYPGWNTPRVRFRQYASLSDKLRQFTGANQEVLLSFKRNKLNILITMRNLSEIFLTPDMLRPHCQTEEEKLFCDLWAEMLPEFSFFLGIAKNNLQSVENVNRILDEVHPNRNMSSIVLHGFYFITPVQHYIFYRWKDLGIHLVFLNLYDGENPSLFGFLEENFSSLHGWTDRENWTITRDDEVIPGKMFANLLEGMNSEPLNTDLEETAYNYVIDFVKDIKAETVYLSPNDEELNTRLRDFHPQAYVEERHFLSYPLGQYILHLHSIWKEAEGEYVLTERIIRESFASGWLEDDEGNARELTHLLDKILPYFTDCRTDREWYDRLNKLMLSKLSISNSLKNYNISRDDHFKAVRVSPGLRFSFFSVPLKDLKRIRIHFQKLIKDARWLLNVKQERMTIKEHFNKIEQLLKDAQLHRERLSNEENTLVERLKESLTNPVDDQADYHISDLADAIIVFLKNGLDKNDIEIDEENPALIDFKIHRFEKVDGLIYLKNQSPLHFCGMDERHFPVASAPMPWPISKELLTKINHPAANMYLFREKHRLSFSKYLFYLTVSYKGPITFSWIRNFNNEENLDKSIYIEILKLKRNNEHQENPYEYEPNLMVENDMEETLRALEALPKEEFVEMRLCPRRFYYSTVSDLFSTYSSSFHTQFLIGNLVKIYGAIGTGKEEIIDLLQNLFPFMSQIRLRALVDNNLKQHLIQSTLRFGLSRHTQYDDITYPLSSTYFQFLTHRGAFESEHWKRSFDMMQKSRRRELLSSVAASNVLLLKATPSVFCKLCPHNSYCEDAYYPVDIKGKGFDDRDEAGTGTTL
ncbi:putative transcriptional regulator [Neobacillus niacini]|uniref:hypothetical protein n=1 Tax=Neobacillus niacini TaxID=86668 RepID=UPI00285E92DB|nr:hypothetical protein [Neobacillus niacini]MDR7079772.1 putative transcriptional regulator [Neobacillus niacini]